MFACRPLTERKDKHCLCKKHNLPVLLMVGCFCRVAQGGHLLVQQPACGRSARRPIFPTSGRAPACTWVAERQICYPPSVQVGSPSLQLLQAFGLLGPALSQHMSCGIFTVVSEELAIGERQCLISSSMLSMPAPYLHTSAFLLAIYHSTALHLLFRDALYWKYF